MAGVLLKGIAKRLVEQGVLTEQEASRAQRAASQGGLPLATFMYQHHIADVKVIAKAASEEFGIPLLDLSAMDIDPDVVKLVSDKLINQFNALPIWKRGSKLFVAISDPGNIQALDQFQFHSGLNTEPVLVEPKQLMEVIEKSLESTETALGELADADLDALEFTGLQEEGGNSGDADIDDAPLVRFVNKMLLDAINKGASDIHFEPYEQRTRVRFRMDGILTEVASPPVALAPRIASRLKVMARLDIAEKRVPQDGRIKMKLSRSRSIDFRVSTCPTLFGEKVVLRILDTGTFKYGVDALGMEATQRQQFMEAIHKPWGMVLVTGPTGSGKTVTLYTAMSILNTADRNISSVEDPAEIYMPGVNQVNINAKAGLSFASTLRSFLRQDPDIIMVGEIRDAETAEIAIKAAQTGHMVLSTLHTNDAPQTLARLLNMGVEPYNIVSAVSLVIAQRLVRKLCNHCKEPVEMEPELLLSYGYSQQQIGSFTPYRAVGCEHCNQGYRGRAGIFQVMKLSEAMNQIILANGNSMQLEEQAKREGLIDLRQAGLLKVMEGVTSLDEIVRVTLE